MTHDEVIQGDLDDASFLTQRARRTDSDCFIYTDPDTGAATLRFGAPRDERAGGRATNHAFVWGESLKSFSPTLTMSNQVSQVTVRGWNEEEMEPIIGTATQADERFRLQFNLAIHQTYAARPDSALNTFAALERLAAHADHCVGR